ncbi:hypothetical protein V6N13_114233 [Hibiscus sabdariffa]
MSVSDYEIQFVRLSQYAHELVPTKRDRYNGFKYGLIKEVKTYVLAYDYTDFDVLVTVELMTKGMSRTETTGPALADYPGWKSDFGRASCRVIGLCLSPNNCLA